jgi:uroporphyrinogen-III decarboxylase
MQPQLLYPSLGHRAFDYAVQMRGMDRLLMDVIDQPETVQQLLEFITSAVEQSHRQREAKGWINCSPDPSGRYQAVSSPWRVNASFLAPDFFQRKPCLADEWAYVTDQTSAGLGPAQYAEFISPYHMRLASFSTQQTVYYHGCETLDGKFPLIAKLPNLRRVHVSPWSSVRRAVEVFQGRVAMEVHAHPGNVFFAFTPEQMRQEIEGLVEGAQGMPMDLNLSDVHSLNGKPEILRTWTQIAQELSWR